MIEALITVALIAILAALALPAYSGYRDRAKSAVAIREIAAMSTRIGLYWQDEHKFPDGLADVKIAGQLDPWGQPYVYYNVDARGRGGARKDKALNPVNTDFDVYSLGPDGKTKPQVSQKDSLDDLIRANNGAYVGKAADF